MDYLDDDPYAAIAGGTPARRKDDDPYAAIAGAYNPMADPSIPAEAKVGTKRQAWAKLVQEGGKMTPYGFKVMDSSPQGQRFTIREDGALWNGKMWVDPDTGKDAGSSPASTKDTWDQGDAWEGKKTPMRRESDTGGYENMTANPDIAILKKRGFRDDEIKRITQAPSYAPGAFQQMEDAFGKGSKGGEAQATKYGRVGQGVLNLMTKGAQLGSRLPGAALGAQLGKRVATGEESNRAYEPELMDAVARVRAQMVEENRNPNDMKILGMDPLEVAGQMAVPIPGGAAAKGAGFLARLGANMGKGALVSMAQPQTDVRYDEQGNSNFGQQLAGQGVSGALVGGAVGEGANLVGKLAKKLVRTPAPADVTKLAPEIEANMLKAAEQDAQALEALAKGKGPRASEAQGLADAIRQVGNDPPKLLQLSAQAKRLFEKASNDEAYGKVGQAMKGMGQTPVPNTVAAIDDTIAELKKNPFPGLDSAIQTLREFRANLLPKTKQVPTGLLDEQGNPIMQEVTRQPDLSWGAVSEARSTLKAKLRSIYDKNPTGGEGAQGIDSRQYQRIADALERDMDEAVKAQKPSAIPLLETARNQYRAYKQKWGENTLNRQMTESETPDELLRKYVGGVAGEDRAGNIKNALTRTGVESTKYQILQNAMTAAEGDPAKFTAEINKASKASGVFFEGVDALRLEGLKKIMRASSVTGKAITAGAGGAMGGAALGPWGAVGGAALGPRVGLKGYAVPSEAIAKAASKLMLTPAGQKLLLEGRSLQSRGPAWDAYMARVQDYLVRTGAIDAGER